MLARICSGDFLRLPVLFASLVLGLVTNTSVQAFNGGATYDGGTCAGCHGGINANTSVGVSTGSLSVVPGAPLMLNVTIANSTTTGAGFDTAVFNGGNRLTLGSAELISGSGVKISNGEFTHTTKRAATDGASTFSFTWKTPSTIPVGSVYTIKTVGLATQPTGGYNAAQWNAGNDLTITFVAPPPPPTTPGAPTGVSATPGNGQATVSFTAPIVDGGAPVTGYTVIASPGPITATGPASPIMINGLSNDTSYTFMVRAMNSVGNGAPSAASSPVTPTAPPNVATGVSAIAGNAQATVSFSAPADFTGTYTATAIPVGYNGTGPQMVTATGTSSPITVTGLTNGIGYIFTVTPAGAAPSAASRAIVPNAGGFAVPDAPSAFGANPGNQMAVIAFSLPSDGGTPITSFNATCSYSLVQGVTLSFTASSPNRLLVLTGLQNGTTYQCGLSATNAVGTSGISNNATLSTYSPAPPSHPTGIKAMPGDGQATVSFGPPLNDGGSAVTGYTASCTDGSSTLTATGTASPLTVTGLTNGTSYACRASASNAQGAFYQFLLYSEPVNVIPATPTVPGAPTGVNATPGNAHAMVNFIPPVSSGGGAITEYTVTSSPDDVSTTGAGSPIMVTGLTNGTAYTFTVTATNSLGNSLPSAASAAVTPNAAVVSAPDSPNCCSFVDAGNGMAILAFDPPADNGSPITSYTAICSYQSGAGVTLSFNTSGPASPLIIGGLTNGTTYQCKLTATNSIGSSPVPGYATAQFIPHSPAPPSAPTAIVPNPGNGQVTISFAPPANDGGSAVLDYTASCRNASTTMTATGTGSPLTVTGLTNGTPYSCWVTARNAQGTFNSLAYRSPTISVTPSLGAIVPNAPTGVVASITGGDLITTSWNAAAGATSYNVYMANVPGVTKANYASLSGGHVHQNATSPFAPHPGALGVPNYIVVTALNSAGESAISVEVSVTVQPTPIVPAAPTGVIGSITGGNLVTTTWNAVSGATSYNVYMANAPGVTKANYSSLSGGHVHTGATSPFAPHPGSPGVPYYIVVTALNSAGESAISSEVSVTVQPTPTVPAVPTGVVGSISGGNLVTTSWNAVAGATSYNVYMANAPGVTKANYASLAGGHVHQNATSPFAPHAGTPGVPYYIVVTAVNSAGESPISAEVSATVPDPAGTTTSSSTSTSSTTSTSTSSTTTSTASTTTTTLAPATLSLIPGWNLVGNSSSGALDVATAFVDTANTLTVWKWVASTTKWAFYAPSLAGSALSDYAASKGYDVLTTINGGEGFWVNAKTAFTTSLPAGTPVSSASFQSMGSGWNLVATGDNKTPSAFNSALNLTPPSVGEIPINLTTLWTWDAALTNWYFYAPSLEKNGGLASYIASKSYLDFGSRVLDPTTGFWVNKP